MRRAGIVEREIEGVWRMPDDLAERGRQYDAQQFGGGVAVELIAPANREYEISARRHGSIRPENPDDIHPLPAARLQGLRSAAEMRQQALHRRRQRVPLLEAQTKPSACPVIADRNSSEGITASKAPGDRQWDDRYPHSLRHHLARSSKLFIRIRSSNVLRRSAACSSI